MSDFEDFVAGQFPLRPQSLDFDRLREVVDQVEAWKASGTDVKAVYADLVDMYAMAYLATNRVGLVSPDLPMPQFEQAVNAWAEGFLFGMLFERRGGHRGEPAAPPE